MIQRSFSSGEVDPALYGRADVDRWKAALKECKNWVVQPEGGLVVRQGFELKGQIPYTSADSIQLAPFEFGPSDSYVQVFHDGLINIVDDGAVVYGDVMLWATIDRTTTPWTVTSTAHGYLTGDTVTAYDGLYSPSSWTITFVSADAFTLDTTVATTGSSVSPLRRTTLATGSPPIAAYARSGTKEVRHVQSGDVMFYTSIERPPYSTLPWRFTRENFSINRALTFRASDVIGAPTPIYAPIGSMAGTAGTSYVEYVFTATDKDGVESSIIRMSVTAGTPYSAAATGTDLLTVTLAAHGLSTNDEIIVDNYFAPTVDPLHPIYRQYQFARVNVTGVNAFTLPGSGLSTGAATLNWYRGSVSSNALTQPSGAAPITITLPVIPTTYGAYKQINVFRKFGRVYGYIGSTAAATFVDNGIIPDTKDTPVAGASPFDPNTNSPLLPVAVGLFQQRLVYGGMTEDVEQIVASHVGNYYAFDPGAEDASGLNFSLAGRSVSGIKHIMEVAGRAVVLSDTSEWVLRGGTSGALTPTAINARADSYHGCSEVTPALIGTSLVYVQRGDRIVREAKYDFSQEALASSDLTLWAKHLFTPEVKRLAYQRTSQILWVLRKDGKLLGLTYIPEQNIWGWHQHVIDGRDIHDICVVSEDGVDRLYCAILDSTNINICRLPLAWESGNVDDHIGFDMALTYDGTLSGTGTLTGGTLWTTAETLTLTASANNFVVGDVGKVFLLRLGDDAVYVTCTAYTSGTEVDVTPDTIVPVALQGVASESIARCAQTFSGLDHLEGETVGVIADGSREPDEVVTAGAITLDGWFARAQAGIIITADAKTLDLEPDEKDTYLGDFKHVTRVYLRVKDTRGLTVGLDATHLEPFMPQYTEDMLVNANPALQSGPVEVLMDATHEELGSVLMRQDTGLPATILNARPVFNAGELK